MNLGLEATIALSAFIGLWVTSDTGDFFLGTLAAIGVGAGVGFLHSLTCVKMRVNQLIAGLLFLTLADGLANFLNNELAKSGVFISVITLSDINIPFLSDIPFIGEIFFQHNIFVYLAYFLAIVFGLILYKTKLGLKIRAVGENPEACDAAGINVNLVRHLCDIFGGAMAGLAGAFITLGDIGLFSAGITGGVGYLAIIVVIFSRWNPYRAILGSLMFGIGKSAGYILIGWYGSAISPDFLNMLPYIVALIVIVIFGGQKKAPAALTVPYWRK
jgi:simple sugar transport system permease protein